MKLKTIDKCNWNNNTYHDCCSSGDVMMHRPCGGRWSGLHHVGGVVAAASKTPGQTAALDTSGTHHIPTASSHRITREAAKQPTLNLHSNKTLLFNNAILHLATTLAVVYKTKYYCRVATLVIANIVSRMFNCYINVLLLLDGWVKIENVNMFTIFRKDNAG